MKKIVGAVAAAVMAAALLSGCGGDSNNSDNPSETTSAGDTTGTTTGTTPSESTTTSDSGDSGDSGATGSYCEDLVKAKVTVQALGGSSLNQENFDKLTAVLHSIADEAPADVADDWNTIGDTLDSISHALQEAGITFDDLNKVGQPGGPTLDPGALQALTTALQGMSGTELTDASKAIETEVTKDCGFALGIGS